MKAPYVHMIMNGRRQAAQRRSLKRGVIRRCLTLGLAAGLLLAVVIPAEAATDVSQTTWNKWFGISFGQRAQTFTDKTTGGLDHVSLMLNYDYGYGSGGTVDIRNVDTTTLEPTGPALPGSVVDLHGPTATYAYPFFSFPFPSPIPVVGGTKYAIVVTINYGVRSWAGVESPVDVGGQAWTALGCVWTCPWSSAGYYPSDFAFETGVTSAPAPPANSAPTVKANLGSFSVTEGAVPTASGTYSDPDGDSVNLSASALTGAAGTVTAGAAGTWSWKGAAADEGQGQAITITADDGHGNKATAQFSTVVGDSTPAVAISFTQLGLILPQQSLTFNGTFTDAGLAVDGAANYTPTWTWSDNYPSSSELVATRAFSAAGTYTATLTVKDDEEVAGSATTTVTVLTPAAALAKIADLVSGQSGLNAAQKHSLLVKLNAAADAAERGNTGAACNQLNAFVNEVDADQKAGRISSGDATAMTNAARLTQRSLGCFRTLVEFLSGL